MVLLLHTGVEKRHMPIDNADVTAYFLIGGIAIPLFFMTSGYLLANKNATLKYRIRKITGILLFTLITCLIWTVWGAIRGRTTEFIGTLAHDYLLSFFQIGPFYVFWYFGAMIIIYAILPLIQKVIHSKYFLESILALLGICTVMCILDVRFLLEKKYVIQTFRIWYWLFYFMLGAYVRLNEYKFKKVKWWHAILACFAFVFFGRIVSAGGNEYLFGSIPCILYALLTFCACLNCKIQNSVIIDKLSHCFLPVYAWHIIILQALFQRPPMTLIEASFSPFIAVPLEFLFATAIIVSLSLVVMKIPYMDKLFRI